MTKAQLKKAIMMNKEKKAVASKDKVTTASAVRTAALKQADVYSKRLASKLDARMEKILEDAEELVKEFFPARYVSASLTRLQKLLAKEGISCAFDKRVSKASIKKTADSDITADECGEAVEQIAKAVVDETECTLDSCDKAIKSLASKHFKGNRVSTTCRMRKNVQASLNETGLRFKF